jgi:CHAT domain-containing protein
VTQEFHLSITSLGSDRYLIRTEDTATGVPIAEAQVQWAVDEWLQLAQPALDNPLVGLLQGTAGVGDRAQQLQQLGSQLYTALFQDEAIRESWLRAQGIAQNRHEILRLRLGFKESRLQRLPWEVLYQGGQALTTRSNLTFARYVVNPWGSHLSSDIALPDGDGVIRVLMVIASPQDQDHLKLLQEVSQLRVLLACPAEERLPIRIDVLEQPDRSRLAQQLEQDTYQVFHYAGHSDFGANGGDLSLVNRQTGLTERLTGEDLAGLLVNNRVALTIFNSCRSGHIQGDDAEVDWRQQNLAQALANRGVPSVIAMAERIPDEVAITFTRLFYHNLCRGYPIDLSLSRTRQGLFSAFGSDQHYWALPILYLQPESDGYLTKRDRDSDNQLDPDMLDSPPPHPLVPAILPAPLPGTSQPAAQEPVTSPPAVVQAIAQKAPVPPSPPSQPPTPQHQWSQSEDEELSRFVEQLSATSNRRDEPPMPALQDEVLTMPENRRAGMEIYDTLPEIKPLPEELTNPSTAMPLSTQERPMPAPDANHTLRSVRSQALTRPEKSLLVWFALGLAGIVGVGGLGFWALRQNGFLSTPQTSLPPAVEDPLVERGSTDDRTQLAAAQKAIVDGRYGDARQLLDQILTRELMGQSDATVNDAVWILVSETTNPDLLYVRGRLHWQEISRLSSDSVPINQSFEQRGLAAQAQEAWNRTDNTFLEGRVARGFANLATGNLDEAIGNLETARALYDTQRAAQVNPTVVEPEDVVILHAYAGLVMAHMRAAGLNPAGIQEDDLLSQASAEEKALLQAEAENEKAIAREYFLTLKDLDRNNLMLPGNLTLVNASPTTWHNWLWTPPLLNEWRRVYRYWDLAISKAP